MMKTMVCVMGVPVTSENRGVHALKESLLLLCREAAPGAELALLIAKRDGETVSDDRGNPIRVVNYRLSPRSRPSRHLAWILLASVIYRYCRWGWLRPALARSTPWIRTVLDAGTVGDIRGGDSFSDIYGLWNFVVGSVPALSVILLGGRLVQFPQTFGPFEHRLARRIARAILSRSAAVLARDRVSREVARELAGEAVPVGQCPDVAFCLPAVKRNVRRPVPAIGLNVNGLMYNGGYTRRNMFGLKIDYPLYLRRVLTELLREEPAAEIWLIPHVLGNSDGVENDAAASQKVHRALPPELKGRVRPIGEIGSAQSVKGIIGECDFLIGSRMHACIAALSQGIPAVGVAYSRKFAGVFETAGMADWVIDGRQCSTEEAVARTVELYRMRDRIRPDLARQAAEARASVRRAMSEILAAGQREEQHAAAAR